MEGQREAQILGEDVVNGSFRELPFLYLGLLSIWTISISCWASNTRRNRHSQVLHPSRRLSPSLHSFPEGNSFFPRNFLLLYCYKFLSVVIFSSMTLQLKNLQWILAAAPLTKVLQLGMSLLFWYDYFRLKNRIIDNQYIKKI